MHCVYGRKINNTKWLCAGRGRKIFNRPAFSAIIGEGLCFRKMTNLDQDYRRLVFNIGSVLTEMRAAQPGSGRVFSILVTESALKHDNLFTTPVAMRLEDFIRWPVD